MERNGIVLFFLVLADFLNRTVETIVGNVESLLVGKGILVNVFGVWEGQDCPLLDIVC